VVASWAPTGPVGAVADAAVSSLGAQPASATDISPTDRIGADNVSNLIHISLKVRAHYPAAGRGQGQVLWGGTAKDQKVKEPAPRCWLLQNRMNFQTCVFQFNQFNQLTPMPWNGSGICGFFLIPLRFFQVQS
jgi:hypothetical protein